jgi:hypothetical protein
MTLMNKRIVFLVLLLVAFVVFNERAVFAQESKLDGLTKFLKEKNMSSQAIPFIIEHLTESGKADYLDELVSWVKADFPDMTGEHGYWKTESMSLKGGVVLSIVYFVNELPSPAKSQKFLEILDELRKCDFVNNQLSSMASLMVDEVELKRRAFELMEVADTEERARGAMMICGLSSSDEFVMDRCKETLFKDKSSQVRSTTLYSMGSMRDPKLSIQKNVALLYIRVLINDPDSGVRESAANILKGLSKSEKVFEKGDLSKFLIPLVNSNDEKAKEVLGQIAARLTTDLSLAIKSNDLTGTVLNDFVSKVRLAKSEMNGELSEDAVVQTWLDWWTPLIPKYTSPYQMLR